MKRALSYAGLLTIATLLGGCGGGAAGTATVPSRPAIAPATHAPPLGRQPRLQRVLFITTQGPAVTLYPANINDKNPKSIGSITQGVTKSWGVWVDRNSTLYVSNNTSPPSVVEYKRGQTTPFKTITKGLYVPGAIAVDSGFNLYVSDDNQGIPVILVYPPGAGSPSETITMPRTVGGLALDPKGDLLAISFDVEHNVATVYSIAPGSTKPVNLGLQGLPGGFSIGVDKAGNIYAGGVFGNISVYPPGSKTPSRYITVQNGVGFYSGLAVTPNGTIYWPNQEAKGIYEFAPGASGPTNEFNGGGIDAAVGYW